MTWCDTKEYTGFKCINSNSNFVHTHTQNTYHYMAHSYTHVRCMHTTFPLCSKEVERKATKGHTEPRSPKNYYTWKDKEELSCGVSAGALHFGANQAAHGKGGVPAFIWFLHSAGPCWIWATTSATPRSAKDVTDPGTCPPAPRTGSLHPTPYPSFGFWRGRGRTWN